MKTGYRRVTAGIDVLHRSSPLHTQGSVSLRLKVWLEALERNSPVFKVCDVRWASPVGLGVVRAPPGHDPAEVSALVFPLMEYLI